MVPEQILLHANDLPLVSRTQGLCSLNSGCCYGTASAPYSCREQGVESVTLSFGCGMSSICPIAGFKVSSSYVAEAQI